jgi:hypothetical protein
MALKVKAAELKTSVTNLLIEGARMRLEMKEASAK